MRMLWAGIPLQAKIIFIGAVIVLIIGFIAIRDHRIEKRGYDRCEAEHGEAIDELRSQSRKQIMSVEKRYDRIRKDIYQTSDKSIMAGPSVSLAIDRMREPQNSGE